MALVALRVLTEANVAVPRGSGSWVKKEILGHLIDSAATNHQRFVRAQLAERYAGPGCCAVSGAISRGSSSRANRRY